MLQEQGIGISGVVPVDEEIADFDAEGKSLFDLPSDSPSVRAVGEIVSRLYLHEEICNGSENRAAI
jgi:CO dehydrogenase nickel-insertion accessory protein CooC1